MGYFRGKLTMKKIGMINKKRFNLDELKRTFYKRYKIKNNISPLSTVSMTFKFIWRKIKSFIFKML